MYSYKMIITSYLSCYYFNNVLLTSITQRIYPCVMGLGKGKKKGGKMAATEKRELPVETDPYRLVNYVCGSNIYVTGEDVQIKPDSEYPPWVWDLRVGGAPPLESLDPNTKEYWLRVRTIGMRRNNRLKKLRKF